jgi:hypothetical protein
MLQVQQMKLVGMQCFNVYLHPFVSKNDGKSRYESGIFKENALFTRYSQLNKPA